jgi:hypothetical protein
MHRREFTRALATSLAASALTSEQILASVYAGVVKVAADVPALTVAGR